MIVEPGFLRHWKTRMLVAELGDKSAPLLLIALWGHCQERKTFTFDDLPPNALKAICDYEGEASKLRSALERCGWIVAQGKSITVCNWEEYNASLMSYWTNGSKGGRPKKTGKKPGDNRAVSPAEPGHNQNSNPVITSETDKTGLDETRPEEKDNLPQPPPGASDEKPKRERKPKEPRPDAYHPDFETVWKVWPRAEGKRDAWRAWEAAIRRIVNLTPPKTLAWLEERIRAYAASPQGQGEFCPHMATWLNKGRYDDDERTWTTRGCSSVGARAARSGGQLFDPNAAPAPDEGKWGSANR